MSSQSNSAPESRIDSPQVAPAPLPAIRLFFWTVQRELWEHRSIYIAPLAVAGAFLFAFLIRVMHLPGRMRDALAMNPAKQQVAIAQPFELAAGLIMGAGFVIGIFYCVDALYGERRDRSILFWKSLPVSDLTAVLAKASIPMVFLQLVTFGVTVALHWIMLLVGSAVLLASGQSAAPLWMQAGLIPMWTMLFCHLLLLHGLWYAPFYGWFLLVSAWARRAPILWALLPLLAVEVLEKIAVNTSHVAAVLKDRLLGGGDAFPFPFPGTVPMDPTSMRVAEFLALPGLWIGLAITVLFLATAARQRRNGGPI